MKLCELVLRTVAVSIRHSYKPSGSINGGELLKGISER
jgi:hypothetical protein